MSNRAPQPKYPVAPSHPTLALDPHTRQFFDPTYWTGAVETRFHLSASGLEEPEFAGRMARFCTGQALIVLQEVGGDGACFVRRFPGIPDAATCRPADVERQWRQLLSLGQSPCPPGSELAVLPELSSSSGLARLHFDQRSGFGVMVCSQGHAYLFDLRDVESAEKGHHPFVELGDAVCPKGMAALVEMGHVEFHRRMDALFGDESSGLYQVLRFYELSDDGRSMEVFGCDYRALKRTLQALKLALTVALGPGGELEGFQRAGWHPWHVSLEESLSVHQSNGWWEDTVAPEKLSGLMGDL